MMSLKNKIQKLISKNRKNKKRNSFRVSAPISPSTKIEVNAFWSERIALFSALFFFAFGMGLISDGKKIYNRQLKLSQRVDYKATLNPYN